MAATSNEEEEPSEVGNVESGPAIDVAADEHEEGEGTDLHEAPPYLTQTSK